MFMCYSNILWFIGDKRVCVEHLYFGELDCLMLCVLQWCVFMETFYLYPRQWEEKGLPWFTHDLSIYPLPTIPTWGNKERKSSFLLSWMNSWLQCFSNFNVYLNHLEIFYNDKFWLNKSRWDIACISNKL